MSPATATGIVGYRGKGLWFCCFDVNDYLNLIAENKGLAFIRNFLFFAFRRYSMKLETERLTLHSLTEEDWPLFLQLYRDPQVIRYLADPLDEAEIHARFAGRLPAWNKHSQHWLCLVMREKASGAALGLTGFRAEWLPFQQAEVGFASLPAGQGKGYGKESLRKLMDFAFNACGFHKLNATVTEGNMASRRLLESCGFQLEGTLRDNFRLAGQWYNDWQLGLLASEYAVAKK
ncbi:acetyltransferase, GNAT family [Serratia odorifera DSM 4582]|uniref:Acetyltransferase, GNAT family n=2 Tax=Serratia odorifera TaxID=618 RepID=D4E3F4_SEROD|nr:acetyltransferase, GNAT family [Serratia odorifera DSM 4582]